VGHAIEAAEVACIGKLYPQFADMPAVRILEAHAVKITIPPLAFGRRITFSTTCYAE